GSKQKEFAEHATNTIRILPEIDNLCEPLDEDIATFSLSDLGSLDAVVNNITIAVIDELGGSELQCHAINSPNNPLKRKRCSQACKKDETLCHRHFTAKQAGKKIVLFE
ncbi:hypothetical protein HDV05_006127, partial [Chytridiales sp. JEL 0842]